MTESPLSDRECELLQLVATGASNKEISQKLFISINTVKVHLRNIYTKLEVASRTEAAMWAVQNGLVDAGGRAQRNQQAEALTGLAAIQAWFNSQAPLKRFGLILAIVIPLIILGFAISALLRSQPEPLPPEVAELVSNLDEERWHQLADMPTARAGLAAVAYENLIYAIAGEGEMGVVGANERYNPQTDTWESLAAKPMPVADVHAGVIGGRIYIPGGRLATGGVTDLLEIYDTRKDTWTIGANLPVPLSAYALATLEGKLYLFGGWDGSHYVNTVYQYDPGQDEWTERSAMPTGRAFAGAAVAGSKIYVIGGYDGEKALDVNEVYSPDLDTEGDQPWITQTPLMQPRYGAGVAIFSDIIYVMGGEGVSLTSVFEYQFESDIWTEMSESFEYRLSKFGFVTHGSGIHILGGDLKGESSFEHHRLEILYTVVIPVVR